MFVFKLIIYNLTVRRNFICLFLSIYFHNNSLIIVPDQYANLIRFINHANHGTLACNLSVFRCNIDGHARVLLRANRDIRKGEFLAYDYNSWDNCYDTSSFSVGGE